MANSVQIIITDQKLAEVFGHADFGKGITKREVVKYALLKIASGYHNGHTSQSIINELGLCTKKLKLTNTGREYLYEAFSDGNNF